MVEEHTMRPNPALFPASRFPFLVLAVLCHLALAIASPSPAETVFPWQPSASETLAERFPPPPGTQRLATTPESFGTWLRSLPLRPPGTPVHLYDGRPKARSKVHAAVLDLDVGSRDLQQCADAVIRLRAEYLWSNDCREAIAFDFTSGDRASWTDWREGLRPKIEGRNVSWLHRGAKDPSYKNFRRYLDSVFTYAGSASLSRELEAVERPEHVRPGDVFIQGGFPGHAVIVLDVAVGARGERFFLLGQSYMPAQDVHVLRNPGHDDHPWYPAYSGGVLETPEWTFEFSDLKRFSPSPCPRTGPFEVGEEVSRPVRISGRDLDLHASHCERTRDTLWMLRLVIDAEGRVASQEFLKPLESSCLRAHIEETVATWRFRPAQRHGQAVSVFYNLTATRHLR